MFSPLELQHSFQWWKVALLLEETLVTWLWKEKELVTRLLKEMELLENGMVTWLLEEMLET